MSQTQWLGRYRLLRVIGEGGMGVVHLGLDPADRAVAVKVVRPHVAADPQTRARLAREVRSLSKVRHPRVAEVLDADFDAELPYVVMRYVPGEALDTVVRRDGPLTGELLDELAVGLFEAVSAIHLVAVVHRDLKPGNVLLLDGSPVVIDFGIARALDDASLTSTGLMVGTPGYLAPEVLAGSHVGTAADWWGWGAVVAYAATGRPPFGSGPLEAVWDRVRRGAVDLAGVEPRLARVLAATLRADPSTRPNPVQLADGVHQLTGRRPQLPGPAEPVPRVDPDVARRPGPGPDTRPEPVPYPSDGATAQRAVTAPPEPDRTWREATAVELEPMGRAATPVGPAAAPVTRVVRRPPPPEPVRPAAGPVTPAYPAHPPLGTAAPPSSLPAGPGAGAPAPGTTYVKGFAAVVQMPRRDWLEALSFLVLGAVAVVTPAGAAVLLLGWTSSARAVQWSRVGAALVRVRAGRLGAGARTGLVVMFPLRLLGALLTTLGCLAVSVLAVSPLLLVGAAVLLRGVEWGDLTTARAVLDTPVARTAAVAVAAILLWWGPGGRAVREGSRASTDPVARHRNGRLVLGGAAGLVLAAAALVVLA